METSSIKTILITGASSGLGTALAREYAREGYRLALTGRDGERLQEVALACRELGAEVHALQCDILAREVLHQWILSIDKSFGIDVVIANAGISGGTSGLSAADLISQSRHIFDVNITGVLNTIEPIIPRMVARKRGQIALISSMAGYFPMPGAAAYSASKAAIRYYGEALTEEMSANGVMVSVISPGFIKTPMTAVNSFPMPFLMTAEKAARIICAGLKQHKTVIRFPKPVGLAIDLLIYLPDFLIKGISRLLPKKSPLQKF